MPPREHNLHNALFALDDVTSRLEGTITALNELNKTLKILQNYLEQLL